MTVSTIIQSATSYLGSASSFLAPWQVGVITLVTAIALPKLLNCTLGCRKKTPVKLLNNRVQIQRLETNEQIQPFQKWVFERRKIDFYVKDNAICIRVVQISDDRIVIDTVVRTRYDVLPLGLRKNTLKKEIMPVGWNARGFPCFSICKDALLHTWIYGKSSTSLLSSGNDLFWKYESGDAIHWSKDIPGNKTKEERIARLSLLYPYRWSTEANSPLFKMVGQAAPRKWCLGNRELSIIIWGNEEKPVFQLVNRALKTTSWTPLNPDLLRAYAKEDRITRLSTQDLDPRTVILGTRINRIFFVEKTSFQSIGSVLTDNQNWAVTLLDTGECEYSHLTWAGHAVILIQGIEENLPFNLFVDFLPVKGNPNLGKVRVLDIKREEIKYAGKTKTFSVSKTNAQILITSARAEKIRSKLNPNIFDCRGKDAMFSRGHNCISWARQKLSLAGITFNPGLIAKIINLPKQYTVFS